MAPKSLLPVLQRDVHKPEEEEGFGAKIDKFIAEYKADPKDPKVVFLSKIFSYAYFWFVSVTELYVGLVYVIPYCYRNYSKSIIYLTKVGACFIFAQAMTNWVCVIYYTSTLIRDKYGRYITGRRYVWGTDCVGDPCDEHEYDSKFGGKTHGTIDMNGLTWDYCNDCQFKVPPRSHHCTVCKACVLKRDHHCFMTGVCVGFYNQRYFIIMNFYIAVASIYGFALLWIYLSANVFPQSPWTDFVLPVTLYKCVRGLIPMYQVFMTFHLYTLWWTGPIAAMFFISQLFIVSAGKTNYEYRNNLKVKCINDIKTNFESVFGICWFMNFAFPTQIFFRQVGDGMKWDNVKVTY